MTKTTKRPSSLLIAAVLLLVAPLASAQEEAAPQNPTTPTAFVQAEVDGVLQIINRPAERGTDAFRQRQDDLKTAVRHFLDYRELCKRALGDHWDEQPPEQQDRFVELMTRLIETNYTVKLGDEPVESNYDVQYDDELVRGDNARVTGTVNSGGETVAVEVMLLRRDDGWVVWDIVTDDVSIQETYAESFDEIIVDEGWDALIQRIQDRLDELETELAQQNSAPGVEAPTASSGEPAPDGAVTP